MVTSSDFERLSGAFASVGVAHLVFRLEPDADDADGQMPKLAKVHGVPEDVLEAGGFEFGLWVNGVLMFFDQTGRYIGNSNTAKTVGDYFERRRGSTLPAEPAAARGGPSRTS